ncbi:hypothetical protein JCM3775_002306 [Rhodotorula graminis]|uniref:Replication protein A C-terminal domain-containing protein n=1 Tax=Rhodotorula graminis (strain WP1) TaxID=578459 RepID=A0A194S5J2_RHOGW|nr:uncharacterized protein RHOBADRAFT_52996 [Rhodotorula graminis WP1]KPV75993.1 hypothetical protein RHOBADRAFT_52996 [Rhodotorula graminis WP1]
MSYAGGGFMSQGGSQSSPGGGKRTGSSALRPITIHQLLNAEQAFAEAEFYIDGAEVKDVTLVACIRNVSSTQTQLNMLVEDGTGQVDARSWKDPAAEETSNPYDDFAINTYVRIIGSLKSFNGKRHLNVNRFRRIDDFNEILFHPIEAIYVHKFYKDGPPGGATGGMNSINATTFDGGAANPYAAGGAGGGAGGDPYADLPNVQRSVMQYVAEQVSSGVAGEEGVNVNSILRQVGGNQDRVRQEYQTLIDDGHLYQTIDDDHVLPTAS